MARYWSNLLVACNLMSVQLVSQGIGQDIRHKQCHTPGYDLITTKSTSRCAADVAFNKPMYSTSPDKASGISPDFYKQKNLSNIRISILGCYRTFEEKDIDIDGNWWKVDLLQTFEVEKVNVTFVSNTNLPPK